MPGKNQKSITLSGKVLRQLQDLYKLELEDSLYDISFAEFIAKHALSDLDNRRNGNVNYDFCGCENENEKE